MDTVFKRKIYNEMLVWKEQSAGESALLIEGPRRVGKSTITKLFKIITKEVGRDNPIETEYIGDVDRAYLIKFFGLREPDVEWFRIEEVQKD